MPFHRDNGCEETSSGLRRGRLSRTGGFKVYPAEIERVVASHPAVAMVAVGRVSDDVRGELARAYVVLRPGASADEAEIIERCRPHLAAYKLPRSVRFVPIVRRPRPKR